MKGFPMARQYNYPAIFDIHPTFFTITFPDLPIEPIRCAAEEIAESLDRAATVLGNYISESLIFGTSLPEPTSLAELPLTPTQKGVMITISEVV
jgi:hypothetical protein